MLLDKILTRAVQLGASDVHLKLASKPMGIRGQLQVLDEAAPILDHKHLNEICTALTKENAREDFLNHKSVDVSYSIDKVGRFRANMFQQRGSVAIVIRNIPYGIPKLKDLHLPPIVEKLIHLERGLVLFTGETGAGKSTTLASFINEINHIYAKHIITIEDPIEYLIPDHKSVVTQREVGVDTPNYLSALKSCLRQDPDIIVMGEMRDAESIETALMAAETGHLVLSTLHTTDAKESILRILSYFDGAEQARIQYQLASSLKAIFSQRLVRTVNQNSFVPAVEVLINNLRVSKILLELEHLNEIYDIMEESTTSYGMQSFDQSLISLLKKKWIDKSEALKEASQPLDFERKLKGIYSSKVEKQQSMVDSETTVHSLQVETILKKEQKDESLRLYKKRNKA